MRARARARETEWVAEGDGETGLTNLASILDSSPVSAMISLISAMFSATLASMAAGSKAVDCAMTGLHIGVSKIDDCVIRCMCVLHIDHAPCDAP